MSTEHAKVTRVSPLREMYGYEILADPKGKRFILYDTHTQEPLFTFSRRSLTSKETKSRIEEITGADQRTVDKELAYLTEKMAVEAIKRQKKTEEVNPREKEVFDKEVYAQADIILEHRDPFQYIVDTAKLLHAGDEDIIKTEWISALSSELSKIKINTWQIGQSGKGKSHSKYTVVQLLPKELYEVFTSASPLSLFYYVKEYGEDALDGILLYIDEVESSRFTLPMLRSLTGQTDITPRHLSVHDAEVLDLKIKGSRTVWFTSVKTFGSEQIKNRFIHLNPDETIEQDERVYELQDEIEREEKEPFKEPLQVAKALAQIIIKDTEGLRVKIPYKIKWVFKDRRWLYPIFLAFIRVITKIRYKQRQTDSEGRLIATEEDFKLAKKLWVEFQKYIIYRVSESAQTVFELLSPDPDLAMTKAEISEQIPVSTRHVQRLCEELLEEGLINARKREYGKEGKSHGGRHAWEYWQASIPKIEDVEILYEESFGHLDIASGNINTAKKFTNVKENGGLINFKPMSKCPKSPSGLFQCPKCRPPVYFATQHDLDLHMKDHKKGDV